MRKSIKKKLRLAALFFREKGLKLFLASIILSNSLTTYANTTSSNSNPQTQSSEDRVKKELAQWIGTIPSAMTPELYAHAEKIQMAIESPDILDKQTTFAMDNQMLIVQGDMVEAKTYQFRELHAAVQKPNYTSVKINFSAEKNQILIEGITGADSSGENGKVVATHIIPDINVAKVIHNNVLTLIIEKDGKISAIPTALLNSNVFESPIPVFQNLFKIKNMNEHTQIEFTHRSEDPRNPKADSFYTASDIRIVNKDAKGNLTTKVIPSVYFIDSCILGFMYLELMKALTSHDPEQVHILEKLIKTLTDADRSSIENNKLNHWLDQMPQEKLDFIRNLDASNLFASLQAAKNSMNEFKSSTRDIFTGNEWVQSFEEMQATLKDKKAAQEKAQKQQMEASRLASLLAKKSSLFDERNYIVTPDNFEEFQKKQNPMEYYKKTKLNQMNELIGKFTSSKITFFSLIGAPIAAYLSFPIAYEHIQALQDIKVLAYLYENNVPDVVKNIVVEGFTYRTVLLMAMIFNFSAIPLAYASAFIYKYSVLALAKTYKNSTSEFAISIKNLAREYQDMTVAQVLLNNTSRPFKLMVMSYWKVFFDYIIGQRSFFTALQKRINPIKVISPESEIGRQLQIESKKIVGLSLPDLSMFEGITKNRVLNKIIDMKKAQGIIDITKADTELRQSMQSLLAQEKKDRKTLTWIIATMTISAKYNIDPATLLAIAEKKTIVTAEEYEKLLKNPDMLKEVKLLNRKLAKTFASMTHAEIKSVLASANPTEFSNMYAQAEKAAQLISQSSALRKTIENLAVNFRESVIHYSLMFLRIGEKSHKNLSTTAISKDNARQTGREFMFQHGSLSFLNGISGKMADIEKPDYLYANPKEMLYTSNAQMFASASSVYGHLVSGAASLNLIFNSIKQTQETRYKPIENTNIKSNEWSENIFKSGYRWVKYTIFSPTKANIGGLAIRKYLNRWDTIFASITFTFISRIAINEQSPMLALLAYSVFFLTAHSAYNFVWDFVVTGNKHIEKIARDNKSWLTQKQYELSMAMRFGETTETQRIRTEIIEHYFSNNKQALYHMIDQLKTLKIQEEIKVSLKQLKDKNPEAIKLMGLMMRLKIADLNQEIDKAKEIRSLISHYYEKNTQVSPETLREMQKLTNDGFLKMTQYHPPIATKENFAVTWLSTIFIGAIPGSYLATDLATKLSDNVYLQMHGINLLYDALILCFTWTTAYYLLLADKPHFFYQKVIAQVKARYQNWQEGRGFFADLRDTPIQPRTTDTPVSQKLQEPIEKRLTNNSAKTAMPLGLTCQKLFN